MIGGQLPDASRSSNGHSFFGVARRCLFLGKKSCGRFARSDATTIQSPETRSCRNSDMPILLKFPSRYEENFTTKLSTPPGRGISHRLVVITLLPAGRRKCFHTTSEL